MKVKVNLFVLGLFVCVCLCANDVDGGNRDERPRGFYSLFLSFLLFMRKRSNRKISFFFIIIILWIYFLISSFSFSSSKIFSKSKENEHMLLVPTGGNI